MMRRYLMCGLRILPAIGLTMLLSGCVAESSGTLVRKAPPLGTTYRESVALLGNPTRVELNDDGSSEAVWLMSDSLGSAWKVGYVLYLKFGTREVAVRGFRLRFGADRRLNAVFPLGTTVPEWSAFPF